MTNPTTGVTYASAGVDIDAGDRAVELMKTKVRSTFRPEVVGDLGGFAGLVRLDTEKYRKPMLASSTDGVGTKLVIARQMDIHDTVGVDLVAMVVDDLVVCGAEPLFLLDYIACGAVEPEKISQIVGGIADGCRWARCALVGGETAEHPGVMGADEYDLSATGVGVVESDDVLGPHLVRPGDVIIALGSSGMHSNGYSLARHVLLEKSGLSLDTEVAEFGSQRTLGQELLTPTRIYARDCLTLITETEVHALSHITGGGIAGNVSRVLPSNVDAVVDRSTWKPQPIFSFIAQQGGVEQAEMERTFNQGIGMTVVLPAAEVDRALAVLTAQKVPAWVCGEIVRGDGPSKVRMVGTHPA